MSKVSTTEANATLSQQKLPVKVVMVFLFLRPDRA